MSFEKCCLLIKALIGLQGYKVILKYKPNQPSFRFERGSKQYDAIGILYMHLNDVSVTKDTHHMYMMIGLSLADSLALINLSSGAWTKLRGDPRYEYYRRTFESITGIELR